MQTVPCPLQQLLILALFPASQAKPELAGPGPYLDPRFYCQLLPERRGQTKAERRKERIVFLSASPE